MSLKVQMNKDPFDDTLERERVRVWLKEKGFEVQMNDQYAGIDMSGMWKGKTWAIEVGKSTDWEFGDKPYAHEFIEIPARKWRHMADSLFHPGKITYDAGMYCFLSNDATCMMVLNFKDLMKVDPEDFDNTVNRTKHGKPVLMVKVPVKYVLRTEKLKCN